MNREGTNENQTVKASVSCQLIKLQTTICNSRDVLACSSEFENILSKLKEFFTFKKEMGKCKLSISWGYKMGIEELGADSEAHILSHCEADRSPLKWS